MQNRVSGGQCRKKPHESRLTHTRNGTLVSPLVGIRVGAKLGGYTVKRSPELTSDTVAVDVATAPVLFDCSLRVCTKLPLFTASGNGNGNGIDDTMIR